MRHTLGAIFNHRMRDPLAVASGGTSGLRGVDRHARRAVRPAAHVCLRRGRDCRCIYSRKFFYLFTCEYCFSHYVAAGAIALTGFRLLLPGWLGAVVAWLAVVWVANVYMSLFVRLRLDIKRERVEIDSEERAAAPRISADGRVHTMAPPARTPRRAPRAPPIRRHRLAPRIDQPGRAGQGRKACVTTGCWGVTGRL